MNSSNSEWRIRRVKPWEAATDIEARYCFPISIALVLQANAVYIELNYQHKLMMWPTPGNRNVSKRHWESQIGAARYNLRNALVYFTFWMSWVKGRVKGERVRANTRDLSSAIEHLLSLSSRASSNVTGCVANGAVEAAGVGRGR